ncbi:LADA_0G02058g1_1 [Lachancea dasiensis]|uniref:1,3-beta-glucanosyltransferase n=1 Tax=Lachancea dasiensis TaxID=1072105 RepID=A0A1G4JR17_9SACH|nr:LADA_0G02058g1_1 [Lachancea dasiensis]
MTLKVSKLALLALVSFKMKLARCSVNPIEIVDQHFYDAVTHEPFFIKGVDYQPGGSSGLNGERDPLSDAEVCARDIVLFQRLGINTIRVYSISPDLDHDACMTMMAAAGIYLLLDVNSPMPDQHLNRYEPWTSYNHNYLRHIFKVIEEFGHYNNTLGFFAGNEVINDELSAKEAPAFVRAVVNDMKDYIRAKSPRSIPVGYSAADDLRYRIPLSQYLECSDEDRPNSSIDFYGVNSYQWCGQQTFQTSGYDQLVSAYKEYTKPVFFSEFGCNIISPRSFEEVEALYSEEMINTFSGGLVYEFTQEPNNYGLVKIDNDGNAHLLDDFVVLQSRYSAVESNEFQMIRQNAINPMAAAPLPSCQNEYENLETDATVPRNLAEDLIRGGVDQKRGSFTALHENDLISSYKIHDSHGQLVKGPSKVKIVNEIEVTPEGNSNGNHSEDLDSDSDGSHNDENKEKTKERNNAAPLPARPASVLWIVWVLFIFGRLCDL